jgi:hypothetical protein
MSIKFNIYLLYGYFQQNQYLNIKKHAIYIIHRLACDPYARGPPGNCTSCPCLRHHCSSILGLVQKTAWLLSFLNKKNLLVFLDKFNLNYKTQHIVICISNWVKTMIWFEDALICSRGWAVPAFWLKLVSIRPVVVKIFKDYQFFNQSEAMAAIFNIRQGYRT